MSQGWHASARSCDVQPSNTGQRRQEYSFVCCKGTANTVRINNSIWMRSNCCRLNDKEGNTESKCSNTGITLKQNAKLYENFSVSNYFQC